MIWDCHEIKVKFGKGSCRVWKKVRAPVKVSKQSGCVGSCSERDFWMSAVISQKQEILMAVVGEKTCGWVR